MSNHANMRKHINFTGILCILLLSVSCNRHKQDYDASGTFEATEVIVSSEAQGRLIRFDMEEGAVFREGETVGYVDSLQLYLQKLQLSANNRAVVSQTADVSKQIAATREQIEKQERELKRFEELYRHKAATQKQVDDIHSQLFVLRRQLDAQISTLSNSNRSISDQSDALTIQAAQLEDQLRKCRITIPINGRILTKYAEQDELATVGKPLFKIADTDNLYLRAYVTSGQLEKVKVGQKTTVLADYGKDRTTSYEGVVTYIGEKAEFTPKGIQTDDERANLVYPVKIAVRNDGYLKIGMYGRVKFE